MRSIEYIAPVASMRGNLSGDQQIKYQSEGGTAWDSAEGAAAQNYQTRYIGNKRSKNGLLNYFSVRQNQSNPLQGTKTSTTGNRLVAAAFAVTASAYAYITIDAQLSDIKTAFVAQFPDKSTRPVFDRWMRSQLYECIFNKTNSFNVGVTGNMVTIVNPLYTGSSVSGIKPAISSDISTKFAAQITALTPA